MRWYVQALYIFCFPLIYNCQSRHMLMILALIIMIMVAKWWLCSVTFICWYPTHSKAVSSPHPSPFIWRMIFHSAWSHWFIWYSIVWFNGFIQSTTFIIPVDAEILPFLSPFCFFSNFFIQEILLIPLYNIDQICIISNMPISDRHISEILVYSSRLPQ